MPAKATANCGRLTAAAKQRSPRAVAKQRSGERAATQQQQALSSRRGAAPESRVASCERALFAVSPLRSLAAAVWRPQSGGRGSPTAVRSYRLETAYLASTCLTLSRGMASIVCPLPVVVVAMNIEL